MKTCVLSIGGGTEQLHAIIVAQSLGFSVVCVDKDHQCAAAKSSDFFYGIDTTDEEQILGVAKKHKISAVIPSPIGKSITSVGYINDQLSLKGATRRQCVICSDKSLFNDFCVANDIPVPKQIAFKSLNDFYSNYHNIDKMNKPLIAKPRFGSGSRGVQLFLQKEDLDFDKNNLLFSEGLLVEEFIDGTVYGADVLIANGKQVFICLRDKRVTPAPWRVEYFFSINRDEVITENVTKVVSSLISCFEFQDCILHIDFILDDKNEIKVIEISPRPSGLMISAKLVPKTTGIDLIREALLNFLSKEYELDTLVDSGDYGMLRYFYLLGEGGIRLPTSLELHGLSTLVDYVAPLENERETVTTMSELNDLGYAIFKDSSLELIKSDHDRLIKLLSK